MGRLTQNRTPDLSLWLNCPEQPHHRELRARVSGPVVFDARCNRIEFPARELDRRLHGDPHLGTLMRALLEAQRAKMSAIVRRDVLGQVRYRLSAHLSGNPSLKRIARDLRVSARTLRRQLGSLDASFQGLLEEVRRDRAVEFLVETDESIERIAKWLGYGNPSNFRRAFRRWTGVAPNAFRTERKRPPSTLRDAAGTPHHQRRG